MNTKGLARHYGCLTPEERLPLLFAANIRGDKVESDRLTRSAPRVAYEIPDFYPRANALNRLALFHLGELLSTAVIFWQTKYVSEIWEEEPGKKEYRRDLTRLMAYMLGVKLGGWRRFCADLQFDPEALLRLPGYDVVKLAAEYAADEAMSAEEAKAWVREHRGADEGAGREDEGPEPEDVVVAGLRDFLSFELASWR